MAMSTAAFGIILLSAGFEGYCFFVKRISIPVRVLFMAAGFLVFHPKVITDLIGLGLILLGLGVHYRGKRLTKNRETPIEATES